MKQPKSKLPWKFSGWFYIIDDNSKPILNITSSPSLLSLEDNNYIIEACNNYPKAVELLNDLKKFCDIVATGRELDGYAWREANELKLQYDKFLKKIEE